MAFLGAHACHKHDQEGLELDADVRIQNYVKMYGADNSYCLQVRGWSDPVLAVLLSFPGPCAGPEPGHPRPLDFLKALP